MTFENTEELNRKIIEVHLDHQEVYPSGRVYIRQIGLNKIAKLLGGKYNDLTKLQRKMFRMDCVDVAYIGSAVKSWDYYINQKL